MLCWRGVQRAAKVGSGHRHKSRQRALGAEEKWLRTHQRHLAEVREDYDVIFYGDDIVEAWRWVYPVSRPPSAARGALFLGWL